MDILGKIGGFLDYCTYDLPLLRCIPARYVINVQKGGTVFFMLYLMHAFQNFSLGAWVYTALHGIYGMIWFTKDMIFPDEQFKRKFNLFGLAMGGVVMGAYWYMGYMMMSGIGDNNPSPEKIFWCIWLFVFGVVLMMVADAQKTFTRNVRPGLITNGLFGTTRNPNYLGEMLLYGSFAAMVEHRTAWIILVSVWATAFVLLMAKKDLSLKRKDAWKAYGSQSWILLPKLVRNSTIVSMAAYGVIGAVAWQLYQLGGLTVLLKA